MLSPKFDPQSFFQRAENVGLHVPASEVFSLLKRTIDLPPQWGALVGREAGDQVVVRAGGVLEGDQATDILFVRLTPVDTRLVFDHLVSRDEYLTRAQVRLWVQPVADRAEMEAFLRVVVGGRRVVGSQGLAAHFEPTIRGVITAFVREHDASGLVAGTADQAASDAVMAAMQAPLFSAGLTCEPPVISFESAGFREVQMARQEAASRQAQHEASRQVTKALQVAREEHLDRLAEMLSRLKEMSAASPGVELPELICTFADHQRGELYQALFATHAPTTQTRWIVVACGDELLFFDARRPTEPSRRLRVEGAAGGARSIQLAEGGVLLVGAARGVYAWPVDAVSPSRTYLVGDASDVRGGFNAVADVGKAVVGSHSELGIHRWEKGGGHAEQPVFSSLTRAAKAIRGVTFFDGDLYCSIDDRIIRWSADSSGEQPGTEYTGAGAVLSAVEPAANGLYAGTSQGDVVFWPTGKTKFPELIHRGMDRPVESLWMERLHGVRRLIFTDTSPRVHARVIGDNFTFHYEAGGQTLRRVEVAPDLLVATTDLRDRLICWSPAAPDQPLCVIQVGALSGRNVQDVCLVPATLA